MAKVCIWATLVSIKNMNCLYIGKRYVDIISTYFWGDTHRMCRIGQLSSWNVSNFNTISILLLNQLDRCDFLSYMEVYLIPSTSVLAVVCVRRTIFVWLILMWYQIGGMVTPLIGMPQREWAGFNDQCLRLHESIDWPRHDDVWHRSKFCDTEDCKNSVYSTEHYSPGILNES